MLKEKRKRKIAEEWEEPLAADPGSWDHFLSDRKDCYTKCTSK